MRHGPVENIAVIGRDIEAALSICLSALECLGHATELVVGVPPALSLREAGLRPRFLTPAELATRLAQLSRDLDRSRDHSVVVAILGGHLMRNLSTPSPGGRADADAIAAKALSHILRDGPEQGVHVLGWWDSYQSLRRSVDRSLAEFGIRILLPMSDRESMLLIDSVAASKLGANRALLYDEERPGTVEKFIPYVAPEK